MGWRLIAACALILAVLAGGLAALRWWPAPQIAPRIAGIFWQPDRATARPDGDWDRLGAHTLVIQFGVAGDVAFFAGLDQPPVVPLPDWARIAREPWAREVILGLAGAYDERWARAHVPELVARSRQLAALKTPLNVTGFYFPVEVDPTWTAAPAIAPLLDQLPRPLWISVYDNSNIGPDTLVDWLETWLPADVGVFFQDGVGVYARSPEVARRYAGVMRGRLGGDRFRLIAEAFRPKPGGGFRAATAGELLAQLDTYDGIPTYLFDGPHYVSDDLVDQVLKAE